jgi:two-component system, NtrC family, response regulator AtoC
MVAAFSNQQVSAKVERAAGSRTDALRDAFMQPVSKLDSQEASGRWRGSPLVLMVGEAKAMLDGGVTERTKSLCQIASASGVLPAMQLLQGGLEPDLVLMDQSQQDVDCLDAISRLRSLNPGLRIILFSEAVEPHVIVRAFRLGVEDILPKPCDPAMLEKRLESLLMGWGRGQHHGNATDSVEELKDGTFVVWASESMRLIRAQAELVAKADCPVLCLGEIGTGKGIVARLLHDLSPRASRPFLKINCAAIPPGLLESELFGHEQGAFTGARRLKLGKFELCRGGTILLDEIEAISPLLQTRLVNVLQDREFARIGGSAKIQVNARIIAATSVDVKLAIAAKTLNEDLCRRLSAFVFKLPALRERREDIPVLLQHYMELFPLRNALPARPVTPELLLHCQEYAWPGNVRELENFVKRYLVLGVESFDRSALGSRPVGRELTTKGSYTEGVVELKELRGQAEANAIAVALDRTQWNRRAAAGLLSISYKTLLHKIRLYAIGGRKNPGSRQTQLVEMLKVSKE